MKKKSLLLALGLMLSLSTNVSAANLDRLGGKDRYETAALINNQMTSETLILVSGNDFADALSSTALVTYYNAEIHLVNNELDANTLNSLKNNEFKKVIIVGGTSAISEKIENELKAKLGNENVERLGGKNRYETSEIVAAKILEINNSFPLGYATVSNSFIVTGKNFADALSVAPIAAQFGYPIILTPGDSIGELGLKTLNEIGSYYKVGGESVVSDKIDTLTGEDSKYVPRLAGVNRYETNKAVIGQFVPFAFDYKNTYVANGLNFPDTLAGSVLAAKNKSPIVFVNNVSTTSNTYAKDVITCFQSENVIALGGTTAVSDETMTSLIDTSEDKEVVFKYNEKIVLPKGASPNPENIDLVALGKKGNDCSWTFTGHKGGPAEDNNAGFLSFSVIIDGESYHGRVEYTHE